MPDLPAPTVATGGALLTALARIQMRNLEALAEAARIGGAGLADLSRRQAESLDAALRAAALRSTAGLPADAAGHIALPFDSLRTAILDATAQGNLLAETAARAGAEVAEILQARLLAALEETKAALLQAVPPGRP